MIALFRHLRVVLFLSLLAWAATSSSTFAQFDAPEGDTPASKPGGNFPHIKEVSPGVLQVGGVTLDKNTKTVTFPATVNMDHGLLEYLLVESGGKTHESAFATKIEPYHLHLAMLLLGAKVPKQNSGAAPPDAIDQQYLKTAPKPKGDNIIIRVRWKSGDKNVEMNVEDLIYDDQTKAPMTRGPWVYNGSLLNNGVFLAQVERSIVALVVDPSALINNTRPGSDNDQIWSVRADKIPKAETPVEFSMQLQPGAPDSKADAEAKPSVEPKPNVTP